MRIFISGGAGFIGSNIARYYLERGDEVLVYDNLSRSGSEINLKWLKNVSKDYKFKFVVGDVRDFNLIKKHIRNSDLIYHMAGQVAVTKSIKDPRYDFEVNALGTLNMLEAFKKYASNAVFVFASTNKVYGDFSLDKFPKLGINEEQILDFHSPYGCSKGAADQYVRDYGRIYNLKTLIYRQSCIYGDRQMGNEDQGWVMHFIKTILNNQKLIIYGNGNQVRDILNIKDLINAYILGVKKVIRGIPLVYNIGGGFQNSISLLDLVKRVEFLTGRKVDIFFSKKREGDQQIYVSDITRVQNELGWKIEIDKLEGISQMVKYCQEFN